MPEMMQVMLSQYQWHPLLLIGIGYEDNYPWLWASKSTVYGEFCKILMTKHCSTCTTGCIANTVLSHSCPNLCIIPSHSHPITAKISSIWRVRQLFRWEDVACYWITQLCLYICIHFSLLISHSFALVSERKNPGILALWIALCCPDN